MDTFDMTEEDTPPPPLGENSTNPFYFSPPEYPQPQFPSQLPSPQDPIPRSSPIQPPPAVSSPPWGTTTTTTVTTSSANPSSSSTTTSPSTTIPPNHFNSPTRTNRPSSTSSSSHQNSPANSSNRHTALHRRQLTPHQHYGCTSLLRQPFTFDGTLTDGAPILQTTPLTLSAGIPYVLSFTSDLNLVSIIYIYQIRPSNPGQAVPVQGPSRFGTGGVGQGTVQFSLTRGAEVYFYVRFAGEGPAGGWLALVALSVEGRDGSKRGRVGGGGGVGSGAGESAGGGAGIGNGSGAMMVGIS